MFPPKSVVVPRIKTLSDINPISEKSQMDCQPQGALEQILNPDLSSSYREIVPQQTEKQYNHRNLTLPELIPGTEADFYVHFETIYKKLLKGHDEKRVQESIKSYLLNKAEIEIYDEELKLINEIEQNNAKLIKAGISTGLQIPEGKYFKDKWQILENRNKNQRTIINNLKPRIKKGAISNLDQLIKTKLAGKSDTQIIFQDALSKSFETLLEKIEENFENGCFYCEDEITYFKTHLNDVANCNADYIPNFSKLFVKKAAAPVRSNTNGSQLKKSNSTRQTSAFADQFPNPLSKTKKKSDSKSDTYKLGDLTKIKLTCRDEYLPKFNLKLEESIRNYKTENTLSRNAILDERVQNKIKKQVLGKFYTELKGTNPEIFNEARHAKPDPIVEEFITQNYVISEKSSTTSGELHEHYKQWMEANHPTDKLQQKTTFGKIIRITSLNGMQIKDRSNGKKQGWRLVRK